MNQRETRSSFARDPSDRLVPAGVAGVLGKPLAGLRVLTVASPDAPRVWAGDAARAWGLPLRMVLQSATIFEASNGLARTESCQDTERLYGR